MIRSHGVSQLSRVPKAVSVTPVSVIRSRKMTKAKATSLGVDQEVGLRPNQQQEPQTRIQATKRCRDCPAEFEVDDPRRRLCDFCRWLHKRNIGNRASRKWYASLTADKRQRIYDRQNAWQKSHRLHIAQHRKSRAA